MVLKLKGHIYCVVSNARNSWGCLSTVCDTARHLIWSSYSHCLHQDFATMWPDQRHWNQRAVQSLKSKTFHLKYKLRYVSTTSEQTHLHDTPLLLHRSSHVRPFLLSLSLLLVHLQTFYSQTVFTLYLTYYYQAQGLSEIFHLSGSLTLSVYDAIQNYLSKSRLKGPLVKHLYVCKGTFFFFFWAHNSTKSYYGLWSVNSGLVFWICTVFRKPRYCKWKKNEILYMKLKPVLF